MGWASVAHLPFCFQKTLHWTFHRCTCYLPNFGSFGYSVSEKIFLEITRKKNCLWWPCLLTDHDEMGNLYRRPTIDPSYQVLVRIHLAKRWKRRYFFFWNRPFKNKNYLRRTCLLTNRDYMSCVYRGPAIDVSYHVSVHLAKRFQRRRIWKNPPIRNKNCLWRP